MALCTVGGGGGVWGAGIFFVFVFWYSVTQDKLDDVLNFDFFLGIIKVNLQGKCYRGVHSVGTNR